MALTNDYPTIRPSLLLDFARAQALDPRITFTRATIATRVNEEGYVETVGSGVPRFDFDPTTLASKGLLIEEQRTNLLTYSEDFGNAAWNATTNITITTDSTTSPTGAATADTVTHTAASVFGRTSVTISAGQTLSYTLFVKKGNTTFFRLRLANGSDAVSSYVNLDTGATASNTAGSGNVLFSSKSIIAYGNGWYRCTLIVTTTTITSIDVTMACAQSDGGAAANGDFAYIWGAQLEAGAFPTSYIPTTTATVQRNSEDATMTGTNFSSWYNAGEGTFFTISSSAQGQTNSIITNCTFDGLNIDNAVVVRHRVDGINFTVRVGAADQAFLTRTTLNPNTFGKFAGAYKFNDIAAVLNAGSVGTDTTAVIPSVALMQIGRQSGAGYLSGCISKIAYYPVRLTDAQLQALTRS